ncbi:MAG: acyltransferase [Sphingopyxis sp.]|nr:acyltransferase [Sphingopyxis sp.]
MADKRSVIYSIEYIRAIAVIMVVMTHVYTSAFLSGTDHIYSAIFADVNIFFTFAAGFLFYHLSRKEPYYQFVRRRAKNVLIPYLIISIPAILIYALGLKQHPNIDLPDIGGVGLAAYLLLTGLHLGPLWFIPMIFILYLSTFVIRELERFRYGYLLAFLVSLGLALTIFPRPQFNDNPLMAAGHYLPIFLLGALLCERYALVRTMAEKYWMAFLILALLLFSISSQLDKDLQFPLKIVALISIFIFFTRFENVHMRFVDVLAGYSFAIFFLHGYIVAVIRILIDRGTMAVPIQNLGFILVSAIVIAICIAIAYLLKRVAGRHSRYLVGR